MNLFASTPRDRTPVGDELLAELATIPIANISDGMDRLGQVSSSIRPVYTGARLCGRALTIWTRAGDNKVVHEALDRIEPGDVLVISAEGDSSRAILGELIAARAKIRGAVGIVVDGAVRDASGLEAYGMPTFASAITGAGPYKIGPGAVGIPIALGGVPVNPGDVIVGDEDGVVVIPSEHAEQALAAGAAKHAAEDASRVDLEAAMNLAR